MKQQANDSAPEWIRFFLLTIAGYFALQTVFVIAHEYVHSGTAWLLGYMPTPLTVLWGNPLTIQGWDEGVPYDRLFPSPGHRAEAAIGGAPLLMHTVFVALGLWLLSRPAATKRRVWFYAVYWIVVMNLTELIAYFMMRGFAATGDTGRFNEGLRLSPWPLFVTGNAFVLAALWLLFRTVMRRLDVVAAGSREEHRIVVTLTAFLMFLWGSGLRIMSLAPDPQWMFGLVGIAGFLGWILADHLRGRGGAPAADRF